LTGLGVRKGLSLDAAIIINLSKKMIYMIYGNPFILMSEHLLEFRAFMVESELKPLFGAEEEHFYEM